LPNILSRWLIFVARVDLVLTAPTPRGMTDPRNRPLIGLHIFRNRAPANRIHEIDTTPVPATEQLSCK
jgi:hypothetical protein